MVYELSSEAERQNTHTHIERQKTEREMHRCIGVQMDKGDTMNDRSITDQDFMAIHMYKYALGYLINEAS